MDKVRRRSPQPMSSKHCSIARLREPINRGGTKCKTAIHCTASFSENFRGRPFGLWEESDLVALLEASERERRNRFSNIHAQSGDGLKLSSRPQVQRGATPCFCTPDRTQIRADLSPRIRNP